MNRERTEQRDNYEVTASDIVESLGRLTPEDWKNAGDPVVTFAPKGLHPQEGKPVLPNFWEQVFNPKNFISSKSGFSYDPEKHFIYILHSLPNPDVNDTLDREIFKAVYTTTKSLHQKPHHMVKWGLHGKPCETKSLGRGGSLYPECKFWDGFFDNLPEVKQQLYPFPSQGWRKNWILKNYFNK